MPYDAKTSEVMTLDGVSFSRPAIDKALSIERAAPTLPAAQAGTVQGSTGSKCSVVFDAPHSVTGTPAVSLFWDSPTAGYRMRVVATITDAMTLSIADGAGSHGDALPANGTRVAVGLVVAEPFTVNDGGGNVQAMGLQSGKAVRVDLDSAAPALLVSIAAEDGKAFIWRKSSGTASPLAGGTTALAHFANGGSVPATPQLAASFNPYV